MQLAAGETVRRTTTDAVYDKLYEEIVSLDILPGTKLSETDVARRFGVSRQPVRNAFVRLGDQGLLVIRPQRATEVRSFSMERIAHARFVRLAVELEVLRLACEVWNPEFEAALDQNLALQEQSMTVGAMRDFHNYDYEFHKLICELSGKPRAFEVIQNTKQQVDRLCVLSLYRDDEAATVLSDHQMVANTLSQKDQKAAELAIRQHLSRLDETIEFIHARHPDYFE